MLESAPELRTALETAEKAAAVHAVKHKHAIGRGSEPFKQEVDTTRGGALDMAVQVRERASGFGLKLLRLFVCFIVISLPLDLCLCIAGIRGSRA